MLKHLAHVTGLVFRLLGPASQRMVRPFFYLVTLRAEC